MCFHPPHDPAEVSGSSSPESFDPSLPPSLRNLGGLRSSHPASFRRRPDQHTRPLFQPSQFRGFPPTASVSTTRQLSQHQRIPTTMFQLNEAHYETFVVASPQTRVSTSVPVAPIGGATLNPRNVTPHSTAYFRDNDLDVSEEVSSFTQYGYPFPHAHALSSHQLRYPRDVGEEDHRNLQPSGLTSALPIPRQTQLELTISNGLTGTFVVPRRSSSHPSVTTQSRLSRASHILEVPGEAASSTTQVTSLSLRGRGGRDTETTETSTARKRGECSRDKQGCLTCRVRRKVSPLAVSFALVFHCGVHISHRYLVLVFTFLCHQKCPHNPNEHGSCSACRGLNIECLERYGEPYPEAWKVCSPSTQTVIFLHIVM